MGRDVTPEAIPTHVTRSHPQTQWGAVLPGAESQDNALSPIDVWLILRSRKRWIVAVFVAGLAVAIAASFLTPAVYESRAVLEIGKVTGTGSGVSHAVEDPVVVVQRLREEHRFEDRHRPKTLPYVDSIGHPRNSSQSLIALTARGRTPGEARAFLTEVTAGLLERHQKLYERTRDAKEAQLRELDRQIEAIEAHARRMADLVKEVGPGQAAVLTLERGNLLAALTGLRAQRTNLVLSLAASDAFPTRPIQEPTLATNPITPNAALYLVLGSVIGLVLGMAVALIVEFLSRARMTPPIRERGTAEQRGS